MSKIVKNFKKQGKSDNAVDNRIMQFSDMDKRIELAWCQKFIKSLINTRDIAALLDRRKESSRRRLIDYDQHSTGINHLPIAKHVTSTGCTVSC